MFAWGVLITIWGLSIAAASEGLSIAADPDLYPEVGDVSVGDDPIFVGADGIEYEVMGDPDEVFNLITSGKLQINGKFAKVPAEFRVQDITETVISDIGITWCHENGQQGVPQTIKFTQRGDVSINGKPIKEDFLSKKIVLTDDFHVMLTKEVCEKTAAGAIACSMGAPSTNSSFDLGSMQLSIFAGDMNVVVHRNFVLENEHNKPIQSLMKAHASIGSLPGSDEKAKAIHRLVSEFQGMASNDTGKFGFLQLSAKLNNQSAPLHGLLGQRWTSPAVVESSGFIGVGATGQQVPHGGKQGEGFIQGDYTQYRMQNKELFGTSFKYNLFECSHA